MRLSLRFVIPLLLVLSALAYLTVPLVEKMTYRWSSRDLELRAALIAATLSESFQSAETLSADARLQKIQSIFQNVTKDERLFAIAYCDAKGNMVRSSEFPNTLTCRSVPQIQDQASEILQLPTGLLHASYQLLEPQGTQLILIHDMSFIQKRSQDTKGYVFLFFVVLALVVSLVTVIVAQLSWMGWMRGIRSLLQLRRPNPRDVAPELRPIVRDIRHFFREMEPPPRDESQIAWSSQTLRQVLKQDLAGEEVIIVSNREPYIHVRRAGHIEIQSPASGLVSALEPIMRACSGTWIAHGSGNADSDVVDAQDKVAVPPENPSYHLKRVWLSEQEEKGYYYGFANEGLWPLCHIAHTRPVFRSEDWQQYLQVNEKFAEAVIAESKTNDPVILVQDYHFAMLPRLIKQKMPNATIITFWHIPWPNSETFGICPWREQILDGMLGSDILGFHTRFHCNNFFYAVDRYMESRIDRDATTVSYGGSKTAVRNYPISIEWPLRDLEKQASPEECHRSVCLENQISLETKLGIGVDRLDYTKGILERFYAVERLLDLEPAWRGRLSFIQIGAPTRSSISEYQNFEELVRKEAARINQKYGTASYQPLILRIQHHEPYDVIRYFRASQFCFVSSLHDGMNLVSKEFVAARDDEQGVLILSQFAGAAKEMPEAIVVNPYNIDQCASAIQLALEMPPEEQKARIHSMRNYVQEYNVFRWAGRMLLDAARMRRRGKFSNPLYQTL
jgi:trehalose 6-phosphate synthase